MSQAPALAGDMGEHLALTPGGMKCLTVIAPDRDEIPPEDSDRRIPIDFDIEITHPTQRPFGERSSHGISIEIVDNLLPAMLRAAGMNERNSLRRRPHCGRQARIGGVN